MTKNTNHLIRTKLDKIIVDLFQDVKLIKAKLDECNFKYLNQYFDDKIIEFTNLIDIMMCDTMDGDYLKLTLKPFQQIVKLAREESNINRVLYSQNIEITNFEVFTSSFTKALKVAYSPEVEDWISYYLYETNVPFRIGLSQGEREFFVNNDKDMIKFLQTEVYLN